jgi:hypothetical protein
MAVFVRFGVYVLPGYFPKQSKKLNVMLAKQKTKKKNQMGQKLRTIKLFPE